MNRRYDLFRQEQERILSIQVAWGDLLEAITKRCFPGRDPLQPWTDDEVLTVLRMLTALLQSSSDRGVLCAFGKGDFPEPRTFPLTNESDPYRA